MDEKQLKTIIPNNSVWFIFYILNIVQYGILPLTKCTFICTALIPQSHPVWGYHIIS